MNIISARSRCGLNDGGTRMTQIRSVSSALCLSTALSVEHLDVHESEMFIVKQALSFEPKLVQV